MSNQKLGELWNHGKKKKKKPVKKKKQQTKDDDKDVQQHGGPPGSPFGLRLQLQLHLPVKQLPLDQ